VVKSGTRWELRKISKERLETKAIFVVQQDRLEAARGILAEYWPADQLPEIFPYDERGIPLAGSAFEQRMAETLALPRPAFTGWPRRDSSYWMTILLGWLPVVGLMFSAILSSRVRRSEGRLLGSHLALFMFVFSLGLLGVLILRAVRTTPSRSEMELPMWETGEAGIESAGPALESPLLVGRNDPRLAARPPDAGAREASAVVQRDEASAVIKRYLVGAAAKDEAAMLEPGTIQWRVAELASPDRFTRGFSRGGLRLVTYRLRDPEIAGDSAIVTVLAEIERSGHASQETMRFILARVEGIWQIEDLYRVPSQGSR
jgi:hypothetical protein